MCVCVCVCVVRGGGGVRGGKQVRHDINFTEVRSILICKFKFLPSLDILICIAIFFCNMPYEHERRK